MTSCSLWYSLYHCSHYLKVLSLQGAPVFNYLLLWGLICRHHPLSELALLRESRSLFSSLSLIVLNIKPLCSALLNRASCGTKTLCLCFEFFSYQLTNKLIFQFLQVLGAHNKTQEEMAVTLSSRWELPFLTKVLLFYIHILGRVAILNPLKADSQNPSDESCYLPGLIKLWAMDQIQPDTCISMCQGVSGTPCAPSLKHSP